MKQVGRAALTFAGVGLGLLGVAEAMISGGLFAGVERRAAAMLAVGCLCGGLVVARDAARGARPVAGLGRVAVAWALGAVMLALLAWLIDVAVVRPLDPPDVALAALLAATGGAMVALARIRRGS